MNMGNNLETLNYKGKIKLEMLFKHLIPLFLVALLLYSGTCAEAQSLITHNDSIRFTMAFTSYSVLDSVYSPMKYHILIENQPKQILLDHYAQMGTSMIFSLLNDPNYDWATNLILYNLYDINALFFAAFDIMTREDWLGYSKKGISICGRISFNSNKQLKKDIGNITNSKSINP